MPEAAAIGQFERRLAELGCPEALARRKAQELAEHRADLKEAVLAEGFSEAEAEARADAQLGEASSLAESLARVMRQSSWWGRHPVIGFCLLPPIGFLPLWFLCGASLAGLVWLLGHIFGPAYLVNADTLRAFALAPDEFAGYADFWNGLVSVCATAVTTGLFCWLVRRSVRGLKWTIITCAICSTCLIYSQVTISPNSVNLGYTTDSRNWLCASIPLGIAAAGWVRNRRRLRRLPAVTKARGPGAISLPFQAGVPRRARWKQILLTPTYWMTALALAGIFPVAALIRGEILQEESLHNRVWPAERAVTLARVQARQTETHDAGQITVDLQPYANASLEATTAGPADAASNNLAELPEGVHTFGGVAFEVDGKIQLMGRSELGANRMFPTSRKGIQISRKCAALDLLHGASGLNETDGTIAKLVLHYADGPTREVEIAAGENVLNWQGPTYTTGPGEEAFAPRAPGSELAWVGSNPWMKAETPELSARLYKSTFANPQPDVEISSVDYVSTLKQAAPFLVGLTLEQSR